MFLHERYILGNELVQKMGIHIANISMFAKQMENIDDYSTIVKFNNCTFIDIHSHKIPKNLLKGIQNNSFTNLSDKLPVSWVKTEYQLSKLELINADMIENEILIAKKRFYVFKSWVVDLMKNKIAYTLDESEKDICLKNGDILGSIKINQNKYLTYYEDFTK